MISLLQVMESSKKGYGNPSKVAELIAKIASQRKKSKLRYLIGSGVKRNLFFKHVLPGRIIEKFIVKYILK